ncbi:hypothetical protein NHF46_09585 [Arthrobacter alpinus]|nr:hypothetical protein [Arthrobacter alpinus]
MNGVQTLRQLFPQWIESDAVVTTPWTVDGVVISDYPAMSTAASRSMWPAPSTPLMK